MNEGQAKQRSVPVVIQQVDGPSLEAEIFRDSNRNLVVLTKYGFSFILDGVSILDVSKLVIEIMGAP